jgi:hypothetical protein
MESHNKITYIRSDDNRIINEIIWTVIGYML